MKPVLFLAFMAVLAAPALAAEQPLPDTKEETRAVEIGNEVRCVVCQSESISDSPADMARDMRQLVREKVHAGWTDQQVLDYLRDRYGDFILLRPPLQPNTWLLWMAPAACLGLAGAATAALMQRGIRLGTKPPPLAPARHRRAPTRLKPRGRKRKMR